MHRQLDDVASKAGSHSAAVASLAGSHWVAEQYNDCLVRVRVALHGGAVTLMYMYSSRDIFLTAAQLPTPVVKLPA